MWNITKLHNSKWIRHFLRFFLNGFSEYFQQTIYLSNVLLFFESTSYAWNQRPSQSVTKIENLKSRIYHFFFKKRFVACNQFLHSAVKTVWGFSSLGHLLCLLTDARFPIQLRMEKATEWENWISPCTCRALNTVNPLQCPTHRVILYGTLSYSCWHDVTSITG